MSQSPYVGQRVSYGGAPCTVRYIGEVGGTSGSWLGVEWDDASRGKHDGSHKGVRYFNCSWPKIAPRLVFSPLLITHRPVKVANSSFVRAPDTAAG